METLLFQAFIYLTAMVIAVPVAARLGLGSVIGYLAAGILIGPVFGLVGSESEELQHVAEFGVVLMLFLIGLELDPKALWAMREKLVGMGGLQVTLTSLVIFLFGLLLNLDWRVALAVGVILSLSSTAIVLQTLNEKQLMQTAGGRGAFSVLLMQDIAVIPILALMPLLALPGARMLADIAEGEHVAMSLVDNLPGWGVTLVTLGAVAAVVLAGHFLVRPAYRFVHSARLREIQTAFALFIVVVIAALMLLVGLSPALGTFLAGVVLANSEFRHEMESDIAPFKGLLLGLFFVTVGSGMNLDLLWSRPANILALTLSLMVLKGLVLYAIAPYFGLSGRNRWLFTLGLAQAGEFGFVLVSFATSQRIVPFATGETVLLVIALSMLLTPLFFLLYDYIERRLHEGDEAHPDDEIDEQEPIIIAGAGRFGQVVNRMITQSGFKTTVLDPNLKIVEVLRTFGFRVFLGDTTRPDLLKAAGFDTAKILVICFDDPKKAVQLTEYARRVRPDIHIIARAHDREHVFQLYRAGANDIVREYFDSALRTARYVLENMGLSEYEAHELQTMFFDMDRASVKELAAVWKPGVPFDKNPEYVARAKELNRELEAALVSRFSQDSAARKD